jgi:hypothetical protein
MFCTHPLLHVRSNYFQPLLFAHACFQIENGEQIKQNWLLCGATEGACRASASAVYFVKKISFATQIYRSGIVE